MKIENLGIITNVNEQKSLNKQDFSAQNEQRNQITKLTNVCYKPLSFGRTWAEHKSWGAVINPETKEASFKIFTYPDTERVTVTVEKANQEEKTKEYELENKGSGIYELTKIPKGEVENGDKYYYTIYRPNQEPYSVKDPYSFKQEQLMDKSTIYDHSLYKWHDNDWQTNKHRISRLANSQNGLTPVNNAKIYEFNTASFTNEGTLESAKEKMDKIKKMGFNAVEIMPVENTYSFNWGYDGVDKLAVAEHLGGPDKLKDFVDCAHKNGLNVIMDMVPNHLGPDGAQLNITGPYTSHPNNFGEAFNFEGKNSRYVRDYMVNAALNWLDNYHCDGIRFDMTQFMESDYTMKQIAAEINYHKPDAFLIAEDGREKDFRVISPLRPEEYGKNQDENIHAEAIERISNNNVSTDNLGFDSEWGFKYYHALKELMYGNAVFSRFEDYAATSAGKVKYTMSHDEIGNYDGSRLIPKLMVPLLDMNNNVNLSNEDTKRAGKLAEKESASKPEADKHQLYLKALDTVRFQKAQLASEKLAKMLQTGELDKYEGKDYEVFADNVLLPLSIKNNSNLYLDTIKNAYNSAFEKSKMGQALTYAMPGPKMVFQGDERADLTPFRFFRQFDSIKDEDYLKVEKGYQHGEAALNESKMDNIRYSKKGKLKNNSFERLTKDLNKLNKHTGAMANGYVERNSTVKNYDSQVIGIHTKGYDDNSELFTVSNIGSNRFPDGIGGDKYYINFPEGEWVEVINTNDKKYGGNGKFINEEKLIRNENGQCAVNLSNYTTAIFKRVG